MDEQILKDLIATAQANNYNWGVVMSKFPELSGYDVQLLKDYVATAEQYNYDYSIINPKFPEFFGDANATQQEPVQQEPIVKKKDGTELPSADGSSEQSTTEQPEFEFYTPKPGEILWSPDGSHRQVIGQDTRELGYRNPMNSLGMYPEQGMVDRALRQSFADARTTSQNINEDAAALAAVQAEEKKRGKKQAPLKTAKPQEVSEAEYALQVRGLRDKPVMNPDGSVSTVKLTSAIIDGKNVVFPTLFPKGANYTSDPQDWMELSGMDAYNEAFLRGEIFEFDSPEKANAFAEGSWKNINNIDAVGFAFYKDRGLDYAQAKRDTDAFAEARDEIDFLNNRSMLYLKDLSEKDQKKYAHLYVNGRRRNDSDDILARREEEYNELYSKISDDDIATAREDFDLFLDKEFQQKAAQAVQANSAAKKAEEILAKDVNEKLGITLEELSQYVPTTTEQKSLVSLYLQNKRDLDAMKQYAASNYEMANTFFTEKFDKNLRGEFIENWDAVSQSWSSGLARGKGAEQILALALGLKDVGDDAEVQDVALKIIQYMQEARTDEQGRAQYRYASARGFSEAFDVFLDDPFELSTAFVAESLSQMLPYGWKLISGSAATGAGAGAVAGLAGGPFAEVTVPGGALAGLGYGMRTGFAATSLALEYTNAVLDAVDNQGYNPEDPLSLAAALQDEQVWAEGKEIGLKRGIPIAVIDYVSGGLAGRVFKVGSIASKTAKVAATVGERVVFDPAAEAFGEYMAQVVSGQEIDAKEIFAEAIGGLGNNTPNAAVNMMRDIRNVNYEKLAAEFSTADGIVNEIASDEKISSWANNMERLGKITPEENQRIQKNVGLRREARDLMGVSPSLLSRNENTDVESRLVELLNAREELTSTQNRREVFKSKIAAINEEIAKISETKQLLPEGERVNIELVGIQSLKKAPKRQAPVGTLPTEQEEDAIQEPSTETGVLRTSTRQPQPVELREVGQGDTESTITTETTTVTPEQGTEEEGGIVLDIEGLGEVSSRTPDEQQFLDDEVQDLENMLGEANSQSPNPEMFQLNTDSETSARKQELAESSRKLMEEVQPDIVEETEVVSEPTMETIPITVTENTELANKVPKMSVKDLVGKVVNYVMADQLKVDSKRMGGPFFPLMDDTFGKVAWASMDVEAAKKIIRGFIKGDYSVVYNMAPSAVDSNIATPMEFTEQLKKLDNQQDVYNQMKDYILGRKFGNKDTEIIHNAISQTTDLQSFIDIFKSLNVDQRAKITQAVLPSANVKATTPLGMALQDSGITQQSVRSSVSEQFARDLPMGAMTMVLEITDADGNLIKSEADIDKAIMTRDQQEAEGIRTHENYPVYIRGRAVAMMEDTVPMWNVSKKALNTMNAKYAGIVKKKDGKGGMRQQSSAEIRADEMYTAQRSASVPKKVIAPTPTQYQQFLNRLTKAFPSVDVVATQEEFDALMENLNARQLVTKSQKVYGAVVDGKLYLNPGLENFNTPVHEFGHIWMNVAKEMAPETYKKGLALVEGTDYVTDVENSTDYKRVIKEMEKAGATEEDIRNYILEEALATAIGDKGESFATAAQKKNFKNWLNELFEFVKKLTGISNMSAEQIQNLSLDEFLNGVVVDLMSENELFVGAEVRNLDNQLQLMTSSSPTAGAVVSAARSKGFSDASIRQVLKNRGYKKADIDSALEVKVDLLTTMPKEFERVAGGVQSALQMYKDVKEKLDRFSTEGPRGGRGTTRTKTFSDIRAKAVELMKAHPTFQEQTDQVQMELLNAFDRQLGIRANTSVSREMAAIRNNLRQRRVAEKNLADAQLQLKNFIRRNLPKSNEYTQGKINALISAVSKVKTVEDLEAQMENVMKVIEQQRATMKKSVVRKIAELVNKKAKPAMTQSGKRRSAGLDAAGQSFFSNAKQVLNAIIKDDVDALAKIAEEIARPEVDEAFAKQARGEKLTSKETALMNLALAFDTFADLQNMSLEETNELFSVLKDTRRESINNLKSRRAARAARNKMVEDEVTAQIAETNPELFDEMGELLNTDQVSERKNEIRKLFRDRKYPQAMKEWLKNFKYSNASQVIATSKNMLRHLGTLTNLVDRVSRSKTAFTDNVYRRLNRANDIYNENRFRTIEAIDSIARAAGFDKGYNQVMNTIYSDGNPLMSLKLKNTKTGATFNAQVSKDQQMRIYALSQNDFQREKLRNQGVSDEVLEEIKTNLGPEVVSFVDGVVEFLSNEYYEQVNSVYSSVNDVNLGYVQNYFPTSTISPQDNNELLKEGDFNGIFNAEVSPAFKERTDTQKDISISDFDFSGVLENHLQSMDKYVAYAEATKDINAFFKIPAVNLLLSELGIHKSMMQTVNMDINPNAGTSMGQDNKVMSKFQQLFTGFALAFKVIQIAKQATSFVNAYADYSYFPKDSKVPNVVKKAIDPVMFMVDMAATYGSMAKDLIGKDGAINKAMEMSPTLRMRIKQGIEGDVYGLESGGKAFKPLSKSHTKVARARRALQQAGAAPTVIGDVLGVMGYMINYNRNIKNGMNPQEAAEAFNNYNATQQSRRGTEKTPLQMSKNYLVRTFTMFGSTVFLQINKVMSSATNMGRDISEGKVPRSKDIREFYLNLAIANALFVATSNIGKLLGDDDDKEDAMGKIAEAMIGMNLLYQLPMLGVVAEEYDLGGRVIAGISGDEYKKKKKFVSSIVNPFSSVGYKVKKQVEKDGVLWGTTRPILEAAMGAQLDPFIGLYNLGFGDDEFQEAAVYDILGISKSYRPASAMPPEPEKESKTGGAESMAIDPKLLKKKK